MIPFLVAGSAAATIGGMYNVGQAYDSWRYWEDYRRNTHRSPRYPFRSGSVDYLKYSAAGVGSTSRALDKLYR